MMAGFIKLSVVCLLIFVQHSTASEDATDAEADEVGRQERVPQRKILVFGGNGFLGASTVERFIRSADNITIVNRGNWYWDSEARIRPYVRHITCDRTEEDKCKELEDYVATVDKFDAVLDFSSYSGKEAREAGALLKGKVDLYMLISTDSVYDVSGKDHYDASQETDAFRPADEEQRDKLNKFNSYGDRKLEAEEAIIAQRLDNGFPFVILRLPDVIGPRDTTFRFWVYQVWQKISKEIPSRPVEIPAFLVDYPISFVYVEDVADVMFKLMDAGPEIRDQVINLAWPQTVTIREFFTVLSQAVGVEDIELVVKPQEDQPLFLYPSNRRGPVDVSKAESLIGWEPTPFEEAIKTSVEFYESVIKNDEFSTQRDEIVQIVSHHLYEKDPVKFYNVMEKMYDINLQHFKPKDEL